MCYIRDRFVSLPTYTQRQYDKMPIKTQKAAAKHSDEIENILLLNKIK